MKIHPISDLPEISRTIKALGRANASTLGYLPEGAFDHYVSQGTVLVAMNEYEECIGYLLWRVARQQAFIVHLCVQANARHKGVAKTLVKELSQRTQSLRGIGLWCRRDYEAHQIWPKLGFTPRAEKPGRSRDGSELTFWWLDHNHPTIFTFAENERLATKVSVVLDANVFFDLNTPRAQNESFALEADWLQDIIELCVTDEIYTEIDRNDDPAERKRLQGAVSKYTLLRHTSDRYSHIFGEIAPLFMKQASKSTLSDHKQLAKAIAADTGFFATRDKDLLKVSDRIYQAYGLAIVRPSEIVVRQDELRREIEYQPVRLAGTLLDIRRIQAHELNSVVETFSRGGMGESKAAFSTILRQNLVTPDHVDCLVALDTTGSMLAVIVLGWHTDELRIPLFRVNKHPLAATLARHLVLRATYQSARRHLRITRMSDRYSGDTVAQALNEASFIHTSDDWLKVNLATVTTACDLADTLGQVALRLGDSGEPYRRLALLLKSDYVKTDIQFMVDVERTLWPAKVTDAAISTYIVPIRPIWAQHLFDEALANETLFGADPRLALNREAVYYRSRRPSVFEYPGRILWYVSSDRRYQWSKKIRACSILDEVVIGSAKELFHQFRRLGVYSWQDVLAVAKGDPETEIMAIKFSNTELFTNSVAWKDLQRILMAHEGHGSQIQSPIRITNELFNRLYHVGTRLT